LNISNIGKITRIVCKPSWAFSVRHIVIPDDYFSTKDNSGNYVTHRNNPFYIYDYNEKKINQSLKGVIVRTDDSSIMLLNDSKEVTDTDMQQEVNKYNKAFAFIRPKNFYQVHKGLDLGLSWLTEDKFSKLFTNDDKGNVATVLDDSIYHISSLGYNRHLLFKPAVVFDKDGNSYQGIELKSDIGHLASMTCEEYTEFYYAMKELMNNFNSMSFQLFSSVLEILKTGGKNGSENRR